MSERGRGEALVLHVIPTPRGRGAQRAARELVDHLNLRAAAARVPTQPVRHQLLCLFDGTPEVRADVSLGHRTRGVPAVGLHPALWQQVGSFVRRADPSIVVAHGGDPFKSLVPAMIGAHRPLVYCVIGTYSGPSDRRHVRRWKRLMARADRIAAVGHEVLDECITCFDVDPAIATMIPNGRDPAIFHPAPLDQAAARNEPVVAFVGALTVQKRPDRFVDVVAVLRDQGFRGRAIIAGDGPLRAALEGPAETAGVELLGQRQDVPDVLRGVDVFVFPSAPAGEGMPGVLIEAGLTGVPAVATDVPGVRTIVADGETGLVVDDDVVSLAAGASKLLGDASLRTGMGAAAIRRCTEQFSTERMVDQWDELLRSLLTDDRPRLRRRGRAAR